MLLAIAVVAISILTAEVGYRVGSRSKRREDEHLRAQVTAVQASVLGLLALLLAFGLSMAEQRFTNRREIMAAEAGAIRTTFLYADALPEPVRSQSRELLRRYVGERHAFFLATREEAPAATARSQVTQRDLMRLATALAHEHPDWDLSAGYLDKVIEMIRLEAARELSLAARVPRTIHVLLVAVAIVGIFVSGMAAGLVRSRTTITLYLVPLLFSLAFLVLADLDLSRVGFITTGDRPLLRLQHDLALEAGR
ncbi:MAG: hypothetical protein HOV81_38970 [Kofleriaceae bacterium]|nr:hypothetical protein [Kofleriaceae bacterium]